MLEEIRKGMCGLQQEVKIAHDDHKQYIQPYGHVPTKYVPGLWRHLTTNLPFIFIIDDSGIKHISISHTKHLIYTLQQKYEITVD